MTKDTEETIRPLNGLVLLRVNGDVGERPNSAGIIIPGTAKGRPKRAKVMALSRGYFQNARLIEPCLRVGEEVIFDAYKVVHVLSFGQLATAEGTPVARANEFFLIHEHHILAVVEPEDTDDDAD